MDIVAPQPCQSPWLSVPDRDADFRQLRHQTKNALARMLLHVSKHQKPGDPARRVAAELERCILLTTEMSNALFGLSHAPGCFAERLRSLCTSLVDLLGDSDQQVSVDVSVRGNLPPALETLVLRVAHELVGNAVKHGMHMRVVGRIQVSVEAGRDGTTVLEVADDGWGCGADPQPGEGLRIANLLAAPHGGAVTLRRRGEMTTATLRVPPDLR